MTRRSVLTLADQAVSSLTNFLLSLSLLRTLDISTFGSFTLAMVGYQLAIGMGRALIGEPLLVRLQTLGSVHIRNERAAAAGAAAWLGLITGAACGLLAVLVGGQVGKFLAILGVGLPLLMLQDVWRYMFFANREPGRALANDAFWGLSLAGSIAVISHYGSVGSNVLTAWVLTGGLAAGLGVAQAGLIPNFRKLGLWPQSQRHLGSRFLIEYIINRSLGQVLYVMIAAVSGVAVLGGISGARTLLGPVNVLILGAPTYFIPEGVKWLSRDEEHFRQWVHKVAVGLAVTAALIGTVVLFLPGSIGRVLVEDNWELIREYLLPMTLLIAATSLIRGYFIGLRVLQAAGRSLLTQTAMVPLVILCTLLGAELGHGLGAAYGLATGYAAAASIWILSFSKAPLHNPTRRNADST